MKHRQILAVILAVAVIGLVAAVVRPSARVSGASDVGALTRRSSDLNRVQQADLFLQSAQHALDMGELRQAQRDARSGLELIPGDPKLIGVLARVAFEREDWAKVAELVEPVVAKADIATLSLLGDAYANLMGHALSQNVFRLIEQRAAQNPEPFNRQWVQYRLDHGVQLDSMVALLERESTQRPGGFGYDLLAWGYYQTGRYQDAKAAMQKALRLGTRDRRVEKQAAMIFQR